MKRLAILGSTGSIGSNTLRVAAHLGHRVVALAAGSNVDRMEAQARAFKPEIVALFDKEKAFELKKRLPNVHVVGGKEGLLEVATYAGADLVMAAMTGTMGLEPTLAAIQAGKTIALANKEVLVSGGELVMSLVKKMGVTLIPVDSEHSAIFQCLKGESKSSVRKIILTSSGGPFREVQDLENVTVEQALCHPNWKMGPKVTIDSSTLMNKGLEVIEARWLFDMPLNQIDVIVHPQSIIHSLVEYVDGSLLAQMGDPEMITPIQYALTYPERAPGLLKPFDFLQHSTLQFYLPDKKRFRCLQLAFTALEKGGSFPCYLNAANEVLVERFLKGEIPWKAIASKLEKLLEKHAVVKVTSLETILEIDTLARHEARTI